QETLSNAFTHFDLVNVLLESRDHQAAAGNQVAPAPDPNADYRFAGSVEYADDGAARLLFRLIDLSDGSIVWSRVFDRVPGGDDKAAAEERIVRAPASGSLTPSRATYARPRA